MGTCGRFPSFILLCKTPWQCSSISTLHKARTKPLNADHVYKRSETVAISSGWKCLQKANIWCEWHVWALKETLVGSRLTESMFSDHRFSRFAAGSACCPVWKLVGAGVCSWLLVKWAVRKSDMTREWSQQFPWVLCVFNFRLLRTKCVLATTLQLHPTVFVPIPPGALVCGMACCLTNQDLEKVAFWGSNSALCHLHHTTEPRGTLRLNQRLPKINK